MYRVFLFGGGEVDRDVGGHVHLGGLPNQDLRKTEIQIFFFVGKKYIFLFYGKSDGVPRLFFAGVRQVLDPEAENLLLRYQECLWLLAEPNNSNSK